MNKYDYINIKIPFNLYLDILFNKTELLEVFDVGACEGFDSIKYQIKFPNSRIHLFEPLKKNIDLAKDNFEEFKIKNYIINEEAISDEIGFQEFFISSGHPENAENYEDWDYGNKSSSLLKPEKVSKTHPWLKFEEIINVKTNTLELYCQKNNIKDIDILHLDVQGAELKVLKGAKNYIDNIKLIWLEVEQIELYKDQPLKKEIEDFLNSKFIKLIDSVDNISGDQLWIANSEYKKLKCSIKYIIHRIKTMLQKSFKS